MICRRLPSFWRGSLSDVDHAAFKVHLPSCAPCRAEVLRRAKEEAERPDLGDRAREVLCGVIGAVGIAREFAGWVVRRAVRAITPEPVKSWVTWTIDVQPSPRRQGEGR